MRIKLVDVDSTIPNLALMKISSYHKSLGNKVEFERLGIPYYPLKRKKKMISTESFDRVYVSSIFKGSMNFVEFDMFSDMDKIICGGTGIDINSKLPPEIENQELDYSIYPENDIAYGFISRGCNRKCYFCIVPKKEGKVHQVEQDLTRIIGEFKKVKFMDNNFLQLANNLEILQWLVDKKVRCQFNQGLDIRLVTSENSTLLSKLNYMGEYIFAFDDWKYRRFIERQLELLKWTHAWGMKFFIYVHPDMELSETVRRIEWLKERQILPYVMRDIKCFEHRLKDFYTDIAAYANQPAFVKKMEFCQFLEKRHKDVERISLHKRLYKESK